MSEIKTEVQKVEKEFDALFPKEYFDKVKGLKHKSTKEQLDKFIEAAKQMMIRAYKIGQDFKIEKLHFMIECAKKEIKLLDLGINTFIYMDDIIAYSKKITDRSIKIIELKNYPREIPDKISDIVIKLKEEKIFDEYFVVFTDYTGEVTKQVEKTKREKDPILFGCFTKESNSFTHAKNIYDRFYYIGDWEDEYCDLTLDKLVAESAKKLDLNIKHEVTVPVSEEEINAYVAKLALNKSRSEQPYKIVEDNKPSVFKRIKSFILGKK
jgi:hypothetical protein